MKFKAFLTDNGINLLEKRILAALDKMGRVCHLYLTRDHAFFLHNLLSVDGVHSVAQFSKESLFHDYRISSNNDDRIAFSVDLSLLHRALRSVLAVRDSNSNALLIKLVKKLPPNSTQATPFLTFEARGHRSAVVQDVPISKPLSRADVQELHLAVESCEQLPATLVMAPELSSLHSFVDGMKHVGDVMAVSVSKYGDLHLQISTSLIALGAEFRKLKVLGERADPVAEDNGLGAKTRVERGVQRGDAMTVQVSVKHFFKSLQCSLAKPDCAFFGIAPQGACLMVFFQFFVPGTRVTDKSFSLHCKLPVLDTGSS
ncbi:checkpoint protein hus1 [Salvia hispanica]|uniref:checkpoint protein hus1 n=1 Tax=Salvia hispanica TaxID=49212 RepID=UPI0020096276|nr:checkpoint protein hus1 [Salvia hispanica]